ncbi:MAG: alpha/beta hydrolase [Acidobacteria bacterium]|nr:alpha/beta hydrolase [Acidobacteriota bacterium]
MAETLVAFAVTLGVLTLLVGWLEPRMAFYPVRGIQATPAAAGLAFTDVLIPTDDGETVHGWWLSHPEPRGQVIFFHGNGGNLSLWLDVIVDLRRHGLSVLAIDYRGYGESTGTASERGLYRDADASVRHFNRQLRRAGTPVVYWGRSIGSPVAAYAASRVAPDALVLESPMPDVRSVLRTNPVLWVLSFLSSYRFPTTRFLEGYEGPLLIVHGDADSIVPFSAGRRVFEAARTARKTFVTIPGADHNDLHIVNPPLYWRAADDFLGTLLQPGERR